MWKRVGSILRFCYVGQDIFCLDSTCFALGENIEFVCCVLNSPMGHYLLKDSPKTGTGDLLVSVQAVNPLKIPRVDCKVNLEFKTLLDELVSGDSKSVENKIADKVYRLYGLSSEELAFIDKNFS